MNKCVSFLLLLSGSWYTVLIPNLQTKFLCSTIHPCQNAESVTQYQVKYFNYNFLHCLFSLVCLLFFF